MSFDVPLTSPLSFQQHLSLSSFDVSLDDGEKEETKEKSSDSSLQQNEQQEKHVAAQSAFRCFVSPSPTILPSSKLYPSILKEKQSAQEEQEAPVPGRVQTILHWTLLLLHVSVLFSMTFYFDYYNAYSIAISLVSVLVTSFMLELGGFLFPALFAALYFAPNFIDSDHINQFRKPMLLGLVITRLVLDALRMRRPRHIFVEQSEASPQQLQRQPSEATPFSQHSSKPKPLKGLSLDDGVDADWDWGDLARPLDDAQSEEAATPASAPSTPQTPSSQNTRQATPISAERASTPLYPSVPSSSPMLSNLSVAVKSDNSRMRMKSPVETAVNPFYAVSSVRPVSPNSLNAFRPISPALSHNGLQNLMPESELIDSTASLRLSPVPSEAPSIISTTVSRQGRPGQPLGKGIVTFVVILICLYIFITKCIFPLIELLLELVQREKDRMAFEHLLKNV